MYQIQATQSPAERQIQKFFFYHKHLQRNKHHSTPRAERSFLGDKTKGICFCSSQSTRFSQGKAPVGNNSGFSLLPMRDFAQNGEPDPRQGNSWAIDSHINDTTYQLTIKSWINLFLDSGVGLSSTSIGMEIVFWPAAILSSESGSLAYLAREIVSKWIALQNRRTKKELYRAHIRHFPFFSQLGLIVTCELFTRAGYEEGIHIKWDEKGIVFVPFNNKGIITYTESRLKEGKSAVSAH